MSLSSLNRFGDLAMLALRVILGAIFIGHGMMKFGSWQQPAEGMNIAMMILSVAEPVGGVALIAGLLTRWAALGLCVVMIGAISMKQFAWGGAFMGSGGVPTWEFDAANLGGLLVLLCYGAGALSLDAVMKKKA